MLAARPMANIFNLWIKVRWLWPHNWLSIAARDQEQAFADGWGAIVAGAQFFPVHVIAMPAQRVDESTELTALVLRAWPHFSIIPFGQRPPGNELFHILQHDDARLAQCCPAQRDPGQAADLLLHRLASLGLAEMLAIRRQPQQANRAARLDLARVHFPHRFAIVLGLRMIGRVHGHGLRVMVNCHINMPPKSQLNAGGGAAASGKVVDDDLAVEIERVLRSYHAATLCWSAQVMIS